MKVTLGATVRGVEVRVEVLDGNVHEAVARMQAIMDQVNEAIESGRLKIPREKVTGGTLETR